MRKIALALLALIVSTPAFATYFVVLKDGTQYAAKERPKVQNGKAMVQLETGSTIAVDVALIDQAKSDEVTKYGGGKVIAVDTNHVTEKTSQQQQSLGAAIKLRKLQQQKEQAATTTAPAAATNALGNDVLDKFARAYENVGIYDAKVTAPNPHTVHVELTADQEDRVFNAISATAFLITRNAGVQGVQIDMVELFMRTTTGGAAGRFQMSRDDAAAVDAKTVSREEYFVHKVIY